MYRYLLTLLVLTGCHTDKNNAIDKIDTLVFESCRIEYPVYKNGGLFLYEGHSIPNEYEYESAQRKLAICLCEQYIAHPSDTLKTLILNIYHTKQQYFNINPTEIIEFDSIVSQRNKLFDPTILID